MSTVHVKSVDLLKKGGVTLGYDGEQAFIGVPYVCVKRAVTVDKGVITFTATGPFLTKLAGWLTIMDLPYSLGK